MIRVSFEAVSKTFEAIDTSFEGIGDSFEPLGNSFEEIDKAFAGFAAFSDAIDDISIENADRSAAVPTSSAPDPHIRNIFTPPR